MAEWLAPRGLSFNEAKTRIVTLEDGFDFLGFTVRRHAGKLITRPSKAAVKRVKHRLAAEMRALRGGNAAAVLATINPIVRGWANYYRGAASSRIFAALDHYLWQLTYKWACYSHPNKPKHLDHLPVLRQVQPRQPGPVGVRQPRQRGLPAQARPGPRSSGIAWSSARRPRTTPP